MSSTRNKNQRSEYSLEQKKNEHSLQYLQNKHYSSNEKISFMELGSIPNFKQNELTHSMDRRKLTQVRWDPSNMARR